MRCGEDRVVVLDENCSLWKKALNSGASPEELSDKRRIAELCAELPYRKQVSPFPSPATSTRLASTLASGGSVDRSLPSLSVLEPVPASRGPPRRPRQAQDPVALPRAPPRLAGPCEPLAKRDPPPPSVSPPRPSPGRPRNAPSAARTREAGVQTSRVLSSVDFNVMRGELLRAESAQSKQRRHVALQNKVIQGMCGLATSPYK